MHWIGAGLLTASAQLASAESARVDFIEPKDGAAVINPFKVKFGLQGMALKPRAIRRRTADTII